VDSRRRYREHGGRGLPDPGRRRAGREHSHLETLDVPGGSLDGAESPVQAGYVTRGGRMLEEEAYRCLWNLLETIPDRDDPSKSARQGIADFNRRVTTRAHRGFDAYRFRRHLY
jgi:myosin-crossreactive antigen